MTSMTGGEAIVSGIVAHGVDTVFGLPGAQVYGLFDAFHQAQLKVIGARHEQACGYMAYGYERSSGRPGVFSVVPGPGVLNAGAAMLTAFGSNEPVLCLTGQVPTQFLGKGRGHLHEMPDQLATLRTFVKWAERIEYPDVAPTMVARAFQEMLSGRRGPAALEMPWDVFTQRAATGVAKVFDPFPAPLPDPDSIKGAAALIVGSKRPMIFVGTGAIHLLDEGGDVWQRHVGIKGAVADEDSGLHLPGLRRPGCLEATVDDDFLHRLSGALHEQYGIDHVTVQVERGDGAAVCRLSPEERV